MMNKTKCLIISAIMIAGIFTTLNFTSAKNNDNVQENNTSSNIEQTEGVAEPEEVLPAAEEISGDSEPDIIEEAQAWCDTYSPYVYGAGGENGPGSAVDCSAFTKAVYNKMGIKLPRVSYDQAKVGVQVSYTPGDYSTLLPGDLVIMNNYGHCGIYAGDGMVIHASSAGGKVIKVPMTNFSSGFVNEIRRVIY